MGFEGFFCKQREAGAKIFTFLLKHQLFVLLLKPLKRKPRSLISPLTHVATIDTEELAS